jgi:NAD(P)-dependent dehydrogenase (short-subunit alcohol dehydrogenase family)
LCESGLKCILACRNDSLGQEAEREFRAAGHEAEYRNLDIESFDSINQFTLGLAADYRCIHVLVNNAGV